MRVEARVAQFSDFLGQEFDTIGRVTEDDGLVDLKFGEKGVEAVDFLLFLHKAVVLSYASKSEFIHKVDLEGIVRVFVLKKISG